MIRLEAQIQIPSHGALVAGGNVGLPNGSSIAYIVNGHIANLLLGELIPHEAHHLGVVLINDGIQCCTVQERVRIGINLADALRRIRCRIINGQIPVIVRLGFCIIGIIYIPQAHNCLAILITGQTIHMLNSGSLHCAGRQVRNVQLIGRLAIVIPVVNEDQQLVPRYGGRNTAAADHVGRTIIRIHVKEKVRLLQGDDIFVNQSVAIHLNLKYQACEGIHRH